MKKTVYGVAALVIITGVIYLINYLNLSLPVNQKLSEDSRNDGIAMAVHYDRYINPTTLVVNLQRVTGDKSTVDVFRVLLQISNIMKDKDFNEILLESQGTLKFKLSGNYFKQLGQNYEKENPVYTVRTFSENVLNVDGSSAYGHITGGILGVLGKQMDDFKDFSEKWFINDLKDSK